MLIAVNELSIADNISWRHCALRYPESWNPRYNEDRMHNANGI